MIKPRFLFWTVSLVAVLLASSCAPAETSPPAIPALPTLESLPATTAPETNIPAPTDTSPAVQAAATSRGPNLEATDPTTVNLASGQLQLVEFFRFT